MTQRIDRISGYEPGPINAPARALQDYWEQSVTQKYELGAAYRLADGRAFRYCQAGAAALAAGELQTTAAFGGSSATVQADLAVQAAAAIGDRVISVTLATDAATLDQFAGGYLAISDAAGQGQHFRINSNLACGAGGTCRMVVDRPVETALTTSSKASMMTNPYKLVVQSPVTTAIGMPVGVATCVVAINYYGWLQTWGMCSVLVKLACDNFAANVLSDLTAAGSVGIDDGALINALVGRTGLATATTDSGLIFLTISP